VCLHLPRLSRREQTGISTNYPGFFNNEFGGKGLCDPFSEMLPVVSEQDLSPYIKPYVLKELEVIKG